MRIDRRTGLNVGVVIAVCVAGPHASAAGAFAPSALRPSRALPGVRLCRAEGINGCGVSVFLAGRESGQGSGKSEQGVSGSQPLPVRRRPGKWGKGRRSDATTSDPAPTPDIERLASVVAAEFATSEEWTRVSDEFLNIYTPSVCRPGAAEYMRGLCNADESEVLRWIRAETRRRFSAEEASMQIFPEQGKWLSQLVMTMNATKVLELGSFTGYSSTCLASAMSPGGHLFCVDISDVYTSLAREAWQRAGLEDRVSLHIGPAAEYLESMLAPGQENRGTFDLIFIDADKENYLPYYRAALQLVRPGGAICIDDTLWSGRVVKDSGCSDRETESIRHVNAFLANDPRVLTLVHPIGDGITVAIRKPHHGQVRRRINDPEGESLAAADTGAFAAHEAWRHPDRPREAGRGATPPMRSETASAEEWGVQVGAEEGGGVEPADAIPCSRPGGEGRDDENAAGEGAGRRRRRRRVGWAKQVSRGGAEEGEERALEREILANIATDGARASALGASVGAEGTSAAVAPYPCALQIQGNFGAGKQELAVHLTAFLESASRRSPAEFPGASKTSETLGLRRVPGEVVVGEWAAQGLLDSMASRPLGTTARERGPREESAGLVVFLDTPPDVCVQRGRVAHPSLGDGSKDAVFQENLRRVDDFLFEKILEQLLDTREGEDERSTASKVEGLLVLDWREVGRPGDVFNMVRGALDGAYQLPQVVRAPSAWRAPRDAYVVTVDELAEMGQGLSEGVDVLATDPRATPGSFLQVTASLLEGAYAMGLQADLTIADTEADGATASTIYVCYPSSLQPPPGYSEREWGLAREAFKRLVLHLLSRLRSVVLVDPV